MKMSNVVLIGISAAILLLAPASLHAQDTSQPVLKGKAAFGDWRADKPGGRRLIPASDQPQPFLTSPEADGIGEAVSMPAGAKPNLPAGFSAELVASGIDNPRALRVAPNGDLFVADSMANQVLVYRLGENGKPVQKAVFATGLHRPYGMA